jgi:hypothetical protein
LTVSFLRSTADEVEIGSLRDAALRLGDFVFLLVIDRGGGMTVSITSGCEQCEEGFLVDVTGCGSQFHCIPVTLDQFLTRRSGERVADVALVGLGGLLNVGVAGTYAASDCSNWIVCGADAGVVINGIQKRLHLLNVG